MTRIPPDLFYISQVLLGAAFIAVAWFFLRPKTPESQFRVREADLEKTRNKQKPPAGSEQDLAQAKMKRHEPLRLGGIRIDGAAHEILGVKATANEEEIQKAYRERMRQYHPDRVGRPGSREWQDAQKIAEAINHARDTLLKKKS